MNQEASVEFFSILDMIGDYFTNALYGYQFCRFCNIFLGIYEDFIPAYNVSGRYFIEKRKLKSEK